MNLIWRYPTSSTSTWMRFGTTLILAGTVAAAVSIGCARKETPRDRAKADAATRAVPEIVREMIATHGGMDAWSGAPTVFFEDEFVAPGTPPSASRVMVEQGRRRAYIEYPAVGAMAAWDGDSCWSKSWKAPFPPRFAVLLNYYFLNLPWLTMDPGVKLVEEGKGRLPRDSTEYATVLMTFEPGTGDTPDDYYRLHIDPRSKQLKGYEYVATYRAILPQGVRSSPENALVYDAFDTVSGLRVPTKYTIYGPKQEVVATCTIRNWSFEQPFDSSRVQPVPGAVVDRSTP